MPTTFDLDPKPLSEKNRLALGGEHARLELQRNAVRQDMADSNGGFRKQIKELNKRAKEISEQLDQDVYRERVEVDEKPIDAELAVEIFKAGTKESLGKRDMTAEEKKAARKRLQPELALNGKGKGNSKMSAVKTNGANGTSETEQAPATVEHRGQRLKNVKQAKKAKGKGARS